MAIVEQASDRLAAIPLGAAQFVAELTVRPRRLAPLVPSLQHRQCVLVAKGEAQLYPRFTPTSEWDTAAGQAILEAAGGAVLTLDGKPLTYGRGGDHLNPFFIAAATPELAAKSASEMQKALSAA